MLESVARTANPQPIAILTYHQIDAIPPKGAPFRSIYVTPHAFARQMAMLKLLGYKGLSMTALMPYLRGERSDKVVGITLDDGYLNNLTHALPVLARHGFSATCYAVSQLAGKTNVWDAEIGIAQTPLMNAAQLRQWVAGGQEVGAHTRHHVRLPQIDAITSRDEITQCKAELEQMLGSPVNHFCYPYGEFTSEHTEIAREAGFHTTTTTQRSRVQSGEDMLLLPRVRVVNNTVLPALWQKVATAYEDRRRS
jgi:peptidoglycan/xylan/chitin deacetylase (PgdA/CDA1 family)